MVKWEEGDKIVHYPSKFFRAVKFTTLGTITPGLSDGYDYCQIILHNRIDQIRTEKLIDNTIYAISHSTWEQIILDQLEEESVLEVLLSGDIKNNIYIVDVKTI